MEEQIIILVQVPAKQPKRYDVWREAECIEKQKAMFSLSSLDRLDHFGANCIFYVFEVRNLWKTPP